MLSSIFQKRKKIQELRSPALQDIKKFRDVYARNAERRHVETPSCLEKSVYKAISCQKELHSVDFRQEDITDPQLIALAETLVEMPMISSLDLRDNRITDDGAKALLEVLRQQIITAKTPLKTDPKTKLPLSPAVPEYTRYVTQVNMKGNEISASVLQELAQYTEILKREDKRVEIRAALVQIDRNSAGGIDEDEFKAVLKLLTGTEPNKKEIKMLMQQHINQSSGAGSAGDSSVQKSAMSLENLLLAKCSSSPSKKAACPPWEALVQVRHATLGQPYSSRLVNARNEYSAAELTHASGRVPATSAALHHSQSQQAMQKTDAPNIQVSTSAVTQQISMASAAPNANAKLATTVPSPPPLQLPISGASTQQQQPQSPVSSSNGSSDRGEGSAYAKFKADFKPPASPPPPLPLTQTTASSSSNPDSRGAASHSFSLSSRGSQENVLAQQSSNSSKAQTSSIAPAAPVETSAASVLRGALSSPDRMSVYSSSSSFSQFIDSVETPRQSASSTPVLISAGVPPQFTDLQRANGEDLERGKSTPQHSVANSVISESPRWKDDDIFTDDEEDDAASASREDDGAEGDDAAHGHELDEDTTSRAGGSSSNDFHSTGSVSSSSKASHNSGLSKSHSSSHQHQRINLGAFASEIAEFSDGDDRPAPPLSAFAATDKLEQLSSSSRTDNDLSSLIYRTSGDELSEANGAPARCLLTLGQNAARQLHAEPQSNNDDPSNDDDDKEERVDSIVSDIVKDGKPRSVAKLVHTEFKRGMLLKDFPNEVPFRNLFALVLSENGLSSLAVFKECRFPCVVVLDLSKNRLTKLADEDFSAFPKLQVLNLAHNRLRSIQGFGKVFDLKALSVDHNAIKSVKNIEHLVQLKVLKLSNNFISTIPALRVLSLNKMLTHLDLDGNPIVETDERQKRKNIVYILNLMPMLLTLGSIPCACLHSKEKKKAMTIQGLGGDKLGVGPVAAHGRALFDTNDMFPEFNALWITQACEALQCFQDVEVQRKSRVSSSYNNDGDDDHWGGGGSNDDESDARHPRKPLNKKQQLEKDEQRSRAVGYRSREKVMPSPPKVKTSVYSFGPPLPPPTAKKPVKKKAPPADPKIVKQQQRRASELSAPKHQPVDKQLLSEEQKRKSRPTFDINMSVAERLLLAQEKVHRRSSTACGSKMVGSAGMQRTKSGVTADAGGNAIVQTGSQTPNSPASTSNPTAWSPGKGNQEVVAFRIEPLRSSTSPAKNSSIESPTLSQPANPGSAKMRSQPSSPTAKPVVFLISPSPPKPDSKTVAGSNTKESNFLQDLAVTNFLNHAEEEFSTALTALNVLLTMSERELSDTKKLVEYRGSLEALDILDERESHAMYARIRDYMEQNARGTECRQAFERLGVVKKSMRQLLEKLETHAPGSSAICVFCRSLRTNDLRSILSCAETVDDVVENHDANMETDTNPDAPIESHETSSPSPEKMSAASPSTVPLSRVMIDDTRVEALENDPPSFRESACDTPHAGEPVEHLACESEIVQQPADDRDEDFDFLSGDKSVFDDDPNTSGDSFSAAPPLDFMDAEDAHSGSPSPSHSPVPVPAYSSNLVAYAVTTDITEDIQSHNDASNVFSSDDPVKADEAGQFDPELDDDTPALATDPSETTFVDDDLSGAWLATEASALDEPNDLDAEGAGIIATDSSDGIFGDEEEQLEAEAEAETEAAEDLSSYEPVEEVVAVASEDATDDFGSCEEEELHANSTSDDHENQDVDANTVLDADSTLVNQPEEENPLSEAEDADDEEAETFGDWEKGFDPSTNHYFWFNHETGESAWTPPEGWPFEVDTPFEADEECGVEGDVEGDELTGNAVADAEYEDDESAHELAQETQEDDSEWGCEGGQSAIESSQRPLSEFDDDIFSDQDLPTF